MDMQELFDTFVQSERRVRSQYHLTLGGLIADLEKFPIPDKTVTVFWGGETKSVGAPFSYRGHYADLAFTPQDKPTTVSEFIRICRDALNSEFEGYKGGLFTMGADTPLWVDTHDGANSVAIIGTTIGQSFHLMTRHLDA